MVNKQKTPQETEEQIKKIHIIEKKVKGLIRAHRKTVQFKQPIVYYIRNNGNVEFYENVTGNTVELRTSDNEEMVYRLSPQKLLNFGGGSYTYKGYIIHEEEAIPLPHDPVLSVRMFTSVVEKLVNDIKNWRAKELEAKGSMWFKIGLGIAVIILAYMMYQMVTGQRAPDPTPVSVVPQITSAIVN